MPWLTDMPQIEELRVALKHLDEAGGGLTKYEFTPQALLDQGGGIVIKQVEFRAVIWMPEEWDMKL